MVRLGQTESPGYLQVGPGAAVVGATQGLAVATATGNPVRGIAAGVGGALIGIAPATGPAAPFVAAAGALLTLAAGLFKGCGATCVEATKIVEQIGPQFDQLLSQYLAAPVHYQSMQTAYLTTFDHTWNEMVAACNNPALGAAGQRCISDRQAGACHYHTSPGGWQNGHYVYPGANNSGSTCWNWFVGYRDPVANDPTVVPDPTAMDAIDSVLGGLASKAGGSSALLWLSLGLIGLGLVM